MRTHHIAEPRPRSSQAIDDGGRAAIAMRAHPPDQRANATKAPFWPPTKMVLLARPVLAEVGNEGNRIRAIRWGTVRTCVPRSYRRPSRVGRDGLKPKPQVRARLSVLLLPTFASGYLPTATSNDQEKAHGR